VKPPIWVFPSSSDGIVYACQAIAGIITQHRMSERYPAISQLIAENRIPEFDNLCKLFLTPIIKPG